MTEPTTPDETGDSTLEAGLDRTRRRLLAGLGTLAVAGVAAGCTTGGETSPTPDPVQIAAGEQCDVCGMVVSEHPGPVGEIFYRDNRPGGHENPARFDSLRGCLFPFLLEHERLDWEATAVYVTDYSTVDYEVTEQEGTPFISSHVSADAFALTEAVTFVVGSGVNGAMGPDFVPFSLRADAEAFAGAYGGDLLEFEDIDASVLSR